MFKEKIDTPIVEIKDDVTRRSGVKLFIKREDLLDPYISGNKYRKLKYNLIAAREQSFDTLLTFGGAFSNHIHAVAYAGFKFGFKTIGVIRGEETLPLNPTLKEAIYFGMQLHYVTRAHYKKKNDESFVSHLKEEFGKFYLIPEGGSNILAVKGCTEILQDHNDEFDHICCSCGTGGTIAGIIASLNGRKNVWGFPALKNGGFLEKDISGLINEYNSCQYTNWRLLLSYHFGGYAKYSDELISFINKFKRQHKIQLDPIYTGKLLFGIYQCLNDQLFGANEKVLAIHTGGLQGIKGFNARFGLLIE